MQKRSGKICTFFKQRRYILTMLSFFGSMNLYSLRANMSIAVVAMTEDRLITTEDGKVENIGPEFAWDNTLTGILLSAFFWGYITTQLLGGYLANRIGGTRVFGFGVAITSIITIVSPWLARIDAYVLLGARVFAGAFLGLTSSSLFTVYANWIPTHERGRIISIANSGIYVGTVIAMLFYAYVASVAGWEWIFWISGGLGLFWYILWFFIQAESPEKDPRITKKELSYIQESLKGQKFTTQPKVPWKAILMSGPAWALTVVMFCETWGFYTMLTLLPKYFKDIYDFDLSKSGFLSALPYLAMGVVIQIIGQISDWITVKRKMPMTRLRKMYMLIGFITQTIFLLGAAFCNDTVGTVFNLTIAVSFGAFPLLVVGVNCLDIAPKFSGILFGINNTFGTLSGILSPVIAGLIVSTTNPTAQEWRIVFYIASALYIFGAIFYTIFGSAQIEPWSAPEKKEERTESEKVKRESVLTQDGNESIKEKDVNTNHLY